MGSAEDGPDVPQWLDEDFSKMDTDHNGVRFLFPLQKTSKTYVIIDAFCDYIFL